MQANPDKFQSFALGKSTFCKKNSFKIGDADITCEKVVILLSIAIDYKLNFDTHIQGLCKTAAT